MKKNQKLSVISPGRINLIGEHTDYNDGLVMPSAIDKSIHFEFTNSETDQITIYASDNSESIAFFAENIPSKPTGTWTDYFAGSLLILRNQGLLINSLDCSFSSNIPPGAGMSSSAAISCGFIYGLNELYSWGLSKWDIAEIAQAVEQKYIGLPCGIMDQFANLFSESGHIQILDCQTREITRLPLPTSSPYMFLCNSRIKHNLAQTEYTVRTQECSQALAMISERFPKVKSIRNIDDHILNLTRGELGPVLSNRIQYQIDENIRVIKVAECLKNDDWYGVGNLLFEGHWGLRDLYEVSCPELDFLIDLSLQNEKIMGARMMGGGFGGCTINLATDDDIEDLIDSWTRQYGEKFGLDLEFYSFALENGTSAIRLPV